MAPAVTSAGDQAVLDRRDGVATGSSCWPRHRLPARSQRHLGGGQWIQYRRVAMRVNRQQQGTMGVLVLAVVLVPLWTGSLTAPSADNPADRLTTSRTPLGIEPAALRDVAPALRPAGERPGPRGRLVLLTILAAVVAGVWQWRATPQRRGHARAGSRSWSTPLEARAPPRLQPA
jgi:hypothetical protein